MRHLVLMKIGLTIMCINKLINYVQLCALCYGTIQIVILTYHWFCWAHPNQNIAGRVPQSLPVVGAAGTVAPWIRAQYII